ncbi:MAG: substrate-binding domain-containing protein [Lachnospiraceae bacterium]
MKLNKKTMLGVFLVIIAGVFVVSSIVLGVKTNKRMEVIFISKNVDDSDFWSSLIAGAHMAAEEYNIDLTVTAPEQEENYTEQNELIRKAIKQKPDAIALAPSDYAKSGEAAQEITDHGIKLVLIDSIVKGEPADAIVATDNYKAGMTMGKWITRECKEVCQIGIISHVKGSSTAIEREKGLRDGLGSLEKDIAQVVYSNSNYSQAYDVTKTLLLEHPEINVLAGLNEYSTVGAARAIKDMGLSHKVKIIGFDNSIEEIELLESDIVDGLVIQKSFDMGYLGIQTVAKLVNGEQVNSINIDSGSKLILKENIYTDENQKLLFPFQTTEKSMK